MVCLGPLHEIGEGVFPFAVGGCREFVSAEGGCRRLVFGPGVGKLDLWPGGVREKCAGDLDGALEVRGGCDRHHLIHEVPSFGL